MTDYSSTIAQIRESASISEISQIVSQYSAQATGSGGVLYSGNVNGISAHNIAVNLVNSEQAAGTTLNIIDNTVRGQLLIDSDVQSAIRNTAQTIFQAQGLTEAEAIQATTNLLYGNGITVMLYQIPISRPAATRDRARGDRREWGFSKPSP
jgi:hypothetical protein